MIFGSVNDSRTLLHIGRELLQGVVEQEILYYKMDLEHTRTNMYGEAEDRGYYEPVRVTCLIRRGDPAWSIADYGPDYSRQSSFAFFKQDLVDLGFRADVGDIVEWHKSYFLIDSVRENQYFLGKDPWYRLDDQDPDRTNRFGSSISIICDTHQTRVDKLQITGQW